MKKDINHTHQKKPLKKHRLRSALSVKPGLKPTTSLKKIQNDISHRAC